MTSSVKVSFLGDASDLARASKQAQNSLDGIGSKADKTGGKARGAFMGMGSAAKAGIAGMVGGSLIAGGKAIFDMAAQMQLMDAKAKTVFGDQVGVVQKWAKANAHGMGLTSKEAVGLSANFADLLIPMGFTREAAAKMSTDVVGLSGALSQWSGGTKSAAEVSEILAAAMLGETDGLKSLGIAIGAADIDAQVLKNGKDKLTGASLAQAKAEATQQLIMEKSTDAQAAYAKSSETLAGKKAKATAAIKEMRDKAISALIPLMVKLGTFISTTVVPAVKGLVEGFKNGTGAGGTLRSSFDKLKATFEANRPAIERLVAQLAAVAKVIVEKVVPVVVAMYVSHMTKLVAAVGFVSGAFKAMVGVVLSVLGTVVNGAAKAFGWVPGIGPKLKQAAAEFNKFRDKVNASLDGIKKNHNIEVKAKLITAGFNSQAANQLGSDAQFRAAGGPVRAGSSYIVGEHEPELFVPNQSGRILNGRQMAGMGGGGGVTFQFNGPVMGNPREYAVAVLAELKRHKRDTGMPLGLA